MALTPELESAQTTANTAAETLNNLIAGNVTIGQELEKATYDAYNDNADIVGPLDTATLGYLGAPSEARAKYATPGSEWFLKTPGGQNAAITNYTLAQAIPMLSLANLYGHRMGNIGDIINAGVGGWEAKTAAAQTTYQNALQNVQNLLNQYQIEQAGKQWIDLGDRKVLVDANGNIISEQPVTDTSGGGGLSDLASVLAALGINTGTTTGDNRVGIENAIEEEPTPVDLSGINLLGSDVIGGTGTALPTAPSTTGQPKYTPTLSWDEIFGGY